MEEYNTPFKFDNFLIESSEFKQKPLNKETKLNIDIQPQGIIFEEDKTFQLYLLVSIKDENSKFEINVKAVGLFSFKDVINKANIDNYFYTNAPAIVFPYVRSYIAGLTALSGLETITIPPLMVACLKDKLKENTTTVTNTIEE